jgi:hypothetical protein
VNHNRIPSIRLNSSKRRYRKGASFRLLTLAFRTAILAALRNSLESNRELTNRELKEAVAVKQIPGSESIRLRIPDRSTRCLMAMLVALSTLIDTVLLFELVNIITAGRPIRPAILRRVACGRTTAHGGTVQQAPGRFLNR